MIIPNFEFVKDAVSTQNRVSSSLIDNKFYFISASHEHKFHSRRRKQGKSEPKIQVTTTSPKLRKVTYRFSESQ